MSIKKHDVFRVRWKPDMNKRNDPYWCFDAQLVAFENDDGEIYLRDTYWGVDDSSGKTISPTEMRRKFRYTKVCNLDEVEEIQDQRYYAPKDVIELHRQHGGYKNYAIKKSAKPNKRAILRELDEQEEKAKHDIRWAQSDLERIAEKRTKVLDGDLEISLGAVQR